MYGWPGPPGTPEVLSFAKEFRVSGLAVIELTSVRFRNICAVEVERRRSAHGGGGHQTLPIRGAQTDGPGAGGVARAQGGRRYTDYDSQRSLTRSRKSHDLAEGGVSEGGRSSAASGARYFRIAYGAW